VVTPELTAFLGLGRSMSKDVTLRH